YAYPTEGAQQQFEPGLSHIRCAKCCTCAKRQLTTHAQAIPVVSHPTGLVADRTAAFQSLQLSALGPVARTYPLTTTIHFSGFNSAACVLASPLLRTPSLDDRTSVRLPTRWLAFGRVGFVG